MQHIMGQNPDLTGRFTATGDQAKLGTLIENPSGEIHRSAQLYVPRPKWHMQIGMLHNGLSEQ